MTNTGDARFVFSSAAGLFAGSIDNKVFKIESDHVAKEGALEDAPLFMAASDSHIYAHYSTNNVEALSADELAHVKTAKLGTTNTIKSMGFVAKTGHIWFGDVKGMIHILDADLNEVKSW